MELLPDTILFEIIKELPDKDLGQFFLTCKKFNKMYEYRLLWKNKINEYIGKTYNYMENKYSYDVPGYKKCLDDHKLTVYAVTYNLLHFNNDSCCYLRYAS